MRSFFHSVVRLFSFHLRQANKWMQTTLPQEVNTTAADAAAAVSAGARSSGANRAQGAIATAAVGGSNIGTRNLSRQPEQPTPFDDSHNRRHQSRTSFGSNSNSFWSLVMIIRNQRQGRTTHRVVQFERQWRATTSMATIMRRQWTLLARQC